MKEMEAIEAYLEEVRDIINNAIQDRDKFMRSLAPFKTGELRKLAGEGEIDNPYNSTEFKKLLARMENPVPIDISEDADSELIVGFAREFIYTVCHKNPDQEEYDMEELLKPFTDICDKAEKDMEAKRKDYRSRLNKALNNKSKLDSGLSRYKHGVLKDLSKRGAPFDRLNTVCGELYDDGKIYEGTINSFADNLMLFQYSKTDEAKREEKYPGGFDAEAVIKTIEDTCAQIDKNIADAEKARKFDFSDMKQELKDFSVIKGKEIQDALRYRLMPNGKPIFSADWAKHKDIPEVKQYCSSLIKALESNRNVLIKRQNKGKSSKKGVEPKVKLQLKEYKGFIEDLKTAFSSDSGTFPEGYRLDEKIARVALELSEFEFKYSKQLNEINSDVMADLNKKTQPLSYPSDLVSDPSSSTKEEYTKWREKELHDKLIRILSSEEEIRPQDSLKMRLKNFAADEVLSSDSDFMEMLGALKNIRYREKFGDFILVETKELKEAVDKYAAKLAEREWEEKKGGKEAAGFIITEKLKNISNDVAKSREDTEKIFTDPEFYYTDEIKIKTEEELKDYAANRSSSVKDFLEGYIRPALNLGLNPANAKEEEKPYIEAVLNGMKSLLKKRGASSLQGEYMAKMPDANTGIDKDGADKLIDSLTSDLVSLEFFKRMRGIEPDYDVIDVLKNEFKTALEEKEKLDLAAPKSVYDDPNYDWSQEEEVKNDYVNDFKGEISGALNGLLSNAGKEFESGLNSYAEKVFSSMRFRNAIGENALEFANKEYEAFRNAFEFKEVDGKRIVEKKEGFDAALDSFAARISEYEFREKTKGKLDFSEFPIKDRITPFIEGFEAEEKYLKARKEYTDKIMEGLFVGRYQGDAAKRFARLLRNMTSSISEGHEDEGSFDRIEDAFSEVIGLIENIKEPSYKYDWLRGTGKTEKAIRDAVDKVSDILLKAGDPPVKRVEPDNPFAQNEGLPDKHYGTRLLEGITNARKELEKKVTLLRNADTCIEPALLIFRVLNKTKGEKDNVLDGGLLQERLGSFLSFKIIGNFENDFMDGSLGKKVITEEDKKEWHKDNSRKIMEDEIMDTIENAPMEIYSELVHNLKNMSWYPEIENYLRDGEKLENIPARKLASRLDRIAPAFNDLRKAEAFTSALDNILGGLDEKKGFIIQNEGLKEYQGLRDALEDYISDLKNVYKDHLDHGFEYTEEGLERVLKGRERLTREIFSFIQEAKEHGWDVNPPKQLENAYALADELYRKLELHEDQKAAALEPPAAQNARENRENADLDGFEILDYRSLMHEEAFKVNQKMNYIQQKYGISEDDLNLLLSIGKKGGNTEKRARSIMEDIIERNMLPRDILDPGKEDEFCRKTVKKIRNELEKGRNESARAELADGLMQVLGTKDFNPQRDYMSDPFRRSEKSGIRAKAVMHNYFTLIRDDGYDPDSWYKSGTLKDMVNLWCEKRMPEDSTDKSRCMGMYEKVNAKWGFGDDMSMLFTKAMDKEFEELRNSMNLSPTDPELKSRIYEHISGKYGGTLNFFRDIVDRTPPNEFGRYNVRLPRDIMDNCYFGGFNSYKLSVELRPVTSVENLEGVRQRMKDDMGVAASEGAFNRCMGLLTKVDEFDLCYNMFETKKRFRMFNGNSDEYKECMKALKTLKEKRNAALVTCNDIRKALDNDLDTSEYYGWDRVFRDLDDAQIAFSEKLKAYNNKVFTESISEKSQNAGMARFAGVQGLAEIVADRNGMLLSQDNEFRKLTGDNVTKMKTYKELFAEEYNKGVVYGRENIHRKAAAAAREKQAEKEVQAPVIQNPRRR